MRRLGRLLRAAGLALLGLTAAFGVILAAAGLVASTGPGSRWVAGRLAGALEGVVAGRFTLGGVTVEPGGDVELRDLELVDPAGHRVIRVARARAHVELGALARRLVGVELELDQPEVMPRAGRPGRADHRRRLRLRRPPAAAARRPRLGDPWRGWTIHVTRLRLRDGAVAWRGAGERTWLEVSGLRLDGAGRLGSAGIAAGLELTGTLAAPLQGPLAIDLGARIEGTRLTVQRLALGADSSRLEAIGEWDWARETFRAAATRVALSERDLAAVAGRRAAVGDLEGRLYAESDGRRLTASVELDAAGGTPGGARGGGSAALALKLGGGVAAHHRLRRGAGGARPLPPALAGAAGTDQRGGTRGAGLAHPGAGPVQPRPPHRGPARRRAPRPRPRRARGAGATPAPWAARSGSRPPTWGRPGRRWRRCWA